MATRVRKGQLDDTSVVAIDNHYISHNNCLITEPTITPTERLEGSVKILNISWNSFACIISGQVAVITNGNIDLNSTDITPTTFYFIVNSSGFPQVVTSLPNDAFVLVLTIRFASISGNIIYYYVDTRNVSISNTLSKIQTNSYLSPPRYAGGLSLSIGNAKVSTTAGGIIYGEEYVSVPAINEGAMLLDDESCIYGFEGITKFGGGENIDIPDGAYIGVWIGLNCAYASSRMGFPYVTQVMKPAIYISLQEVLEDRMGVVQCGFQGEYYYNQVLPLAIVYFRKGGYLSDLSVRDLRFTNFGQISTVKTSPDFTIVTYPDDAEIVWSNDDEKYSTGQTLTKLKETIVMEDLPAVRISFELKTGTANYMAIASIYKNGSGIGSSRGNDSTTYVDFSEDFYNIAPGDKIQIYGYNTTGGKRVYVRNLRFKYARQLTKIGGFTLQQAVPIVERRVIDYYNIM
jgi:hypothetical protein